MSHTLQADSADPLLVIVPNVGMAIDGARVFMDIKAVEGLQLYARFWPGPVRCICRATDKNTIGYGRWYERGELPFEAATVPQEAGAAQVVKQAQGAALILGGADNHLDLALVKEACDVPVALIIEYSLKTRLDMLRLERRGTWQSVKTAIWLLLWEPARRRALAHAAGLQANGTPAYDAYGPSNRDPLLYFDTRLKESLFIGSAQADAKARAVLQRRGLRLAFSGRLESIKGADYLVPVMRALHRRGCTDVSLDIYGDGSLRSTITQEARAAGLEQTIRLHGPVPFEEALVPALRETCDLFVCPHPQGDPSCTYLETLGCGVPIVGFLNAAFKGVLQLGACGVGVAIGDVEGMADAIMQLDQERQRLSALTRNAAQIASHNLFESVFEKRVAHLHGLITPGRGRPPLTPPWRRPPSPGAAGDP